MNLVWHRADLRLHDNPAVEAALQLGATAGLVILDPAILDKTSPRRRAWFCANVRALRESWRARGGILIVRSGVPWEVLPRVVRELGAREVFAIGNSTPYGRHRDQLADESVLGRIAWYHGQYIHEPGSIMKNDGSAYTVFAPFAKRWWAAGLPNACITPGHFPVLTMPPGFDIGNVVVEDAGIPLPPAGEDAALHALDSFVKHKLTQYHEARDGLDGAGVSRLAWYFNIGALSARLAAQRALALGGAGAQTWVAELCWRDFSGDLLHHHPHMVDSAFDRRWDAMPWRDDANVFDAWLHGRTGIPVVDACMRELQATGFLSNRGRMISAQFAVKLALLPWRKCERAFRELLLDGDTASNLQGWQWAGGLGVDAAPYFRVFNLVTQARTHDPDGTWLRRWVPECGGDAQPCGKPVIDLAGARRHYLDAAGKIARSR